MKKGRPLGKVLDVLDKTHPIERSGPYIGDGDGQYLRPKTLYEIEADLSTKIRITKDD